jgi:site-specific recombinase XerD
VAPRPSSEALIAAFLSKYPNERTRATYGIALRRLAEWAATHDVAHLADIQKPHLDLYASDLAGEGLGRNSLAGKQGVVKRFYDYLVESRTIKQSPVPHGWVPTQVPRAELDVLTEQDVEALYGVAHRHQDFLDVGLFIVLAGWDGLALGPIRDLRAEDVRFDADGIATVPLRRKDGTIHNRPLSVVSSRHLAQVVEARPSGTLSYPTRSEATARAVVGRHLKTVARWAGIDGKMSVSRLWWSYRSRMLEAGTPVEVILESLGRDASGGGAAYSRHVALPKHGPESEGEAAREAAVHEENAAELLRQAEYLCDQKGVTAIAPIVIAGAALEMVLRRMCESSDVEVRSKQPGISAYADALKRRTLISKFAHQQLQAYAKLRNDAAHGVSSDEVSIPHAKVMIRGVGLFLSGDDDRSIRSASQAIDEVASISPSCRTSLTRNRTQPRPM